MKIRALLCFLAIIMLIAAACKNPFLYEDKTQPIILIEIDVTAPATAQTPDTKVIFNDSDNFTASSVTWNMSGSSVFKGNTVYTATVTLTAKKNYKFT